MRRLLIAAAAVLAVLVPAGPAWAHNELLGSTPAAGATLTSAPDTVSLSFAQKLNPDFTTIVLSDGALQRVPTSAPATDAGTGSVTPSTPLGNGVYTVAYRIVSKDGHVVQGSYQFTVADPAQPAAAVVTTAATAAQAPASPSGTGVPRPVLIGWVLLAVVVAAGAFVAYRRRRSAASRAA